MNMENKNIIKTVKTIYPQIYAYVIPNYSDNEGWIKIGYTERQNVDVRISEQLHTAQIKYSKLWSEPAKYCNSDEWFSDKQFHDYLRRFKNIEQRKGTELFYYNGTPEQSHIHFDEFRNRQLTQIKQDISYELRPEQKCAVESTLDYFNTHQGGEFLWNAKPRFGKTLCTYDLARKMNAQNVLIVTNRPAIASSWFDDFENFIAWQTDYHFVSTADTLKNRSVFTREDFLVELEKQDPDNLKIIGCVAFISLQDLKGAISFGGIYNKLKWVKDLHWDLLVIDEAHEGVDTIKTDTAFDEIKRNYTLHLSGTPFKAIARGKFAPDQIYNWTYADEQNAKEKWDKENEIYNPYEDLPRLNLFSYQMSKMITDEVNKGANIDGRVIDFAFDLNEFFSTNDSGQFVHEKEVQKWLDTLTRNEKYPFSTKELRSELKHTFWILNRVASARALEKLLKNHKVFKNYEIVLAAGDGRTEDDPVVDLKSLERVRKAIKENKKTITLSVGQLTTGVTVPEWSAVMMLSNIKSPSLYMQAAFRAQNPWQYELDGKNYRKQNAYVFDFAPERTLIIYDEFATNLNSNTAGGAGTFEDREANIKKLLNFFPVIAEDSEGKMIELDVKQILTIPKTLKAQEIVNRGFMSNLLFQNISNVFSFLEAREILEQLNPVAPGRVTPNQTSTPIDTKRIVVDDNGNALVDNNIVIAQTKARFGEKLYADLVGVTENYEKKNLGNIVAESFIKSALEPAREIARDNSVSCAQAEQVVRQNANTLARDVEKIKIKAEISLAEAEVDYNKEVAEAECDKIAIDEAKQRFEKEKQVISENLKKDLVEKVEEKSKEMTLKTTEDILYRAEEKKKNSVEDDIRARLRGFARTIPSFLMAYGSRDTTLENFDTNIKNSVFKEVTGISLDQFRALRDKYNFFDSIAFNESVMEFLNKKEKLANYFDDALNEDIFDYIPPQKTNQIYTPKTVVKFMIDKMEEEYPDLFSDKNKTFADLYVKSGLYLTEIIKRLFRGLESDFPDREARLKHILENQIYGFAPSEIIYNIAKNFIFGKFNNIADKNLVCRNLTKMAKNGDCKNMKFDVVVGNPPYQDVAVGDNNQPEPIYNLFYDLAKKLTPRYCLISPARFLSKAGDTPKVWNAQMLKDPHLKILYYEQNSAKLFPNTDIKGGIVILLRDNNINYGEIGVFTTFEELHSILIKVSKKR